MTLDIFIKFVTFKRDDVQAPKIGVNSWYNRRETYKKTVLGFERNLVNIHDDKLDSRSRHIGWEVSYNLKVNLYSLWVAWVVQVLFKY